MHAAALKNNLTAPNDPFIIEGREPFIFVGLKKIELFPKPVQSYEQGRASYRMFMFTPLSSDNVQMLDYQSEDNAKEVPEIVCMSCSHADCKLILSPVYSHCTCVHSTVHRTCNLLP